MKCEQELPSLAKLKSDLEGYKIISSITGNRKNIKKLEKQYNELVNTTNKFCNYFSNEGWVIHNLLSTTVMLNAVKEFELNGLEKAESILVEYYSKEDNIGVGRFTSLEEFRIRLDLLKYAFSDHINGRFYSSIPLFLMITDGVINDYTRAKGFFSNDTDLNAWDCMVGADEGLNKIKNIFNQSRKKTNTDEIRIPYRNGILHGRDLNYSNKVVSSKCIGLIFAVYDWINRKNDEDRRKEKFDIESKPVDISELALKIIKVDKDKKAIEEWNSKKYVLGVDMPVHGEIFDYEEHPFLIPVIRFCKFWESKNYGSLAQLLDYVYKY